MSCNILPEPSGRLAGYPPTSDYVEPFVKDVPDWKSYQDFAQSMSVMTPNAMPTLAPEEVQPLRQAYCNSRTMAPADAFAGLPTNLAPLVGGMYASPLARRYEFGKLAQQSIIQDIWYSVDSHGVVRVHSWSTAGYAS